MDIQKIVTELDIEIARLQHIRDALLGVNEIDVSVPVNRRSGRPKGSKNVTANKATPAKKTKGAKRVLSPEGRERIAEAMKRRWAEQSKSAK